MSQCRNVRYNSTMIDDALKRQLRNLIGSQVQYLGQLCQVIEVLDSEQALVVQCISATSAPSIQGNQFGEATRRVNVCHTIKLYGETNQLNAEISDWLNQASL